MNHLLPCDIGGATRLATDVHVFSVPFFLRSYSEPRYSQNHRVVLQPSLGGGFKYFLFSPLLGEMFQFD